MTNKEENVIVKEDGKAFHLLEMEDSMEEAIKNAEKVRGEQLELIEIVKSSDKAEKFKDFIKDAEKQVEDITAQIEKLKTKLEALKWVNAYNDKEVIEKLIVTLGLFE